MARAREVEGPDGYEEMFGLLRSIAESGPVAVHLAGAQLTSADPQVRATACALLGVACERHEEVRAEAAGVLLAMAATETDSDVQWSIAHALGATTDVRGVPVLVALAGHASAGVRLQVAASLPAMLGHTTDDTVVATLIDLCGDPDADVRNWATFGLGWQTTADGPAVRQVLWERAVDSDEQVREEGIRGLARRRDPRALPLLATLLTEDSAHLYAFDAAAFLADPMLVPLLAKFDHDNRGVAEALRECDPTLRAHRDDLAWSLFEAVHTLAPEADVALFGERFRIGLRLRVGDAEWSVEALLERSGDDPDRAARLVLTP